MPKRHLHNFTEPAHVQLRRVLPRQHPLARLEAVPIEALAGQDIITYAPHTAIGKPVEEAFLAAGIELQRRIQVNYSMTAFVLAAQGGGIALVEPMLLSSASMPSLVARPILPRIEVRTVLVHAIGHPPTKTSGKLVELIREHIGRIDDRGGTTWMPEVSEAIS